MEVESYDGTMVPLTLVYATDVLEDMSTTPVVLVGYGCYGECTSLRFDPSIFPLLKRGFTIVSFFLALTSVYPVVHRIIPF